MPVKILFGLLLCCLLTAAQTRPDCGALTTSLERRLEAQHRLLVDWAGLTRYGSENTEIAKPAAST
ncbi:MAG: hypothetical protein ABI882_15130, partial [Acidobacteriota bacterium]